MTLRTPIQAIPTAGRIPSEHKSPIRPRTLHQKSPADRAEAEGPLFRLLERLLAWLSGPVASANDRPGAEAGLDAEASHVVASCQRASLSGGFGCHGFWFCSGPWVIDGPF